MRTAPAAPADAADALFARFRSSGDPAALAALFDRTAPHLFRIALSVAPDAATAEEAVQETFLAVLEDAGRCDPAEPVMPWLVSVLRHKVLDARRRERRVPDPLRLEPRILPESPADAADRRDAVDRVRAALDRLEEPYRTVALLRWEYGLEPGEIAHARGEPPGTVRSTLSRALERLRRDLGGAAVLALVLGARPADGLAAIRRTVLSRAGAAAATGTAGFVVGGVLVSKAAVAAAVAAAFLAGGLLGGGTVAAFRPSPAPAPDLPQAAAPTPRVEPRATQRLEGKRTDAAPAPGTESGTAQAPVQAEGAARAKTLALLEGLDGTWFTAWKIGGTLAKTEPGLEVLEVLRERWDRIPNVVDRQNLMKGFAFSECEWRLDVLDLGARDGDAAIRDWAWDYLEPYAGRRFDGDVAAYAAWRGSVSGSAPGDLLARNIDGLLGRLSTAPGEEASDLLRRLRAAVLRLGPAPVVRASVVDAIAGWLPDAERFQDPGPLLGILGAARPGAERAGDLCTMLLERGGEAERRGLCVAGALKLRSARDAVALRLCSSEPALATAAADALAEIGDLRAVGALVDAVDLHRHDAAGDCVLNALQLLAVPDGPIPVGAAGWREWWERNRERIEREAGSPKEER